MPYRFTTAILALALSACDGSAEIGTPDRTDSIAGIDTNNNGVRDDVDSLILEKAQTQQQRSALLQAARATQQSLLVDVADAQAVKTVADSVMRSIACMSSVYGSQEGRELILRIESQTADTSKRLKAFSNFQQAVSGGVHRLPSRKGACSQELTS